VQCHLAKGSDSTGSLARVDTTGIGALLVARAVSIRLALWSATCSGVWISQEHILTYTDGLVVVSFTANCVPRARVGVTGAAWLRGTVGIRISFESS